MCSTRYCTSVGYCLFVFGLCQSLHPINAQLHTFFLPLTHRMGVATVQMQLFMKKEDEIQSRRDFFKKAAKMALPIIAVVALPSLLASCGDKEDSEGGSGGGSGGSSTRCPGTCSSHCQSSCKLNAVWQPASCSGSTCKGACYSACKTSCIGSSSGGGGTSCSGCSSSCTANCSTSCYSSCKGSSRKF